MNAIVPSGNNALTPTSMESAIQLAEMMARGKLVPAHLHNSPGDCLMIVEQALRWQMSPFAVAQCTSVIQGKLMFEGKLVAAALNASGILSSRLDYDFTGTNGQRAVTVRGTLNGETKPREVTVFLAEAKTTNSMWTKQPDQQLVYAGTRVWARRHAPEVMLGVYAPEEFDRAEPFNGTTLEHAADNDARPAPARAAAAPTPRAARVYDTAPPAEPHPLDEPDGRRWLANLRTMLANAQSQEEVVEIAGHDSVGNASASAPDRIKQDISALLADAYKRFVEPNSDLPEVEIIGAEKMAAG